METYITSVTPLSFVSVDSSGRGIRTTLYRVDGGDWVNYTAMGPFSLADDGRHSLEWFSEDYAGNVEDTVAAEVAVDDSAPEVTLSLLGPQYGPPSRVFVSGASRVMLSAIDHGVPPVGLDSVTYRVDEVDRLYASPFGLPGPDGEKTLWVRAFDRLGNGLSTNRTFILDTTAPETSSYVLGGSAGPFTPETEFMFVVRENGSGVKRVEYRVDGGPWREFQGTGVSLPFGEHTLGYRSVDNVDNVEAERLLPVRIAGGAVGPNWKPLVAVTLTSVLAIAGASSARGSPWKGTKGRRGSAIAFTIASAPFVLAELGTGILSLATGMLTIPPVLGVGTFIDASIVTVGIVIVVWRRHRGSASSVPTAGPSSSRRGTASARRP